MWEHIDYLPATTHPRERTPAWTWTPARNLSLHLPTQASLQLCPAHSAETSLPPSPTQGLGRATRRTQVPCLLSRSPYTYPTHPSCRLYPPSSLVAKTLCRPSLKSTWPSLSRQRRSPPQNSSQPTMQAQRQRLRCTAAQGQVATRADYGARSATRALPAAKPAGTSASSANTSGQCGGETTTPAASTRRTSR